MQQIIIQIILIHLIMSQKNKVGNNHNNDNNDSGSPKIGKQNSIILEQPRENKRIYKYKYNMYRLYRYEHNLEPSF